MQPEPNALQLARMTTGVLFQPMALDRSALANFYAQASTAFEFTMFNLLPDGGRMAASAAPDADDLIIQPNRMQVNMNLNAPFDVLVDRVSAQFDAVRQFFRPQQFLAIGTKIIGSFELGERCADFLENRLLRPDAPLDLLGLGRIGTGFRFHFQRDGVWDVRVEPLFSDVSRIYTEVDAQSMEPFQDLRFAREWMEGAERYCQRELLDFIRSLPS